MLPLPANWRCSKLEANQIEINPFQTKSNQFEQPFPNPLQPKPNISNQDQLVFGGLEYLH
ncbi:hypothetical protein [Pontibacter harenae]|uniref:hypothetical protein n=1 Tax=Pontibacter harenae TaxID=2894083 RepID=UPI001E5A527E|nr:hypothetical protein [Pontibacter harenae]MCC9167594.1 hypothetical protein [Pontibacter harenae]